MVDPVIILILAFCFSMLLIGAGFHKLTDRIHFQAILSDYQVLPPFLLPLAPTLIALLEIGIGISWLLIAIGFNSLAFAEYAPLLTALLLVIYGVAMAVNLIRGRDYIDCGCSFNSISATFSGDDQQRLSYWLVARNLAMAIAALYAGSGSLGRDLIIADYLFIALAVVASALSYAAFNQLLQNQGSLSTWRQDHG